jgi:hypothetical protein
MSVDLRTSYLGLELKNPLVASASPLTGHLKILRHGNERESGTHPERVSGAHLGLQDGRPGQERQTCSFGLAALL